MLGTICTDPMLHHYSMNSLEDGNGTNRNHQFIHTSIYCHSMNLPQSCCIRSGVCVPDISAEALGYDCTDAKSYMEPYVMISQNAARARKILTSGTLAREINSKSAYKTPPLVRYRRCASIGKCRSVRETCPLSGIWRLSAIREL